MSGMQQLPAEQIVRIAERHGALEVRIFGSRARGNARPESDLDLLIKAGPTMSLLDVAAIEVELEDLLRIPVQIVTEGALHPLLRDEILAEAQALVA